MLLALRTFVHIWADGEHAQHLRQIDAALERNGFGLIDLDWAAFELLPDDSDHFTWAGLVQFSSHLARALRAYAPRLEEIHIVGDSTIDFWNWDENESRTGAADAMVINDLREIGIRATIDVVCGSGFVAMSDSNEHFRARLSRGSRRNATPPIAPKASAAAAGANATNVLVVGGWNDQTRPLARVVPAIAGVARLLQ